MSLALEDGRYWSKDPSGKWDFVEIVNGYGYLAGSDFPLGAEDFAGCEFRVAEPPKELAA